MSVVNIVALLLVHGLVCFTLGAWLMRVWERRQIDHRWYCGHEHKANLPCEWNPPPAPRPPSVIEVSRKPQRPSSLRELN